MEEFDLEKQYQLFLERIGLSEKTMHPIQKAQIKQTFYGAIGQLIILFRDNLTKLEEDKAVNVLGYLLNQVGDYFIKESNMQN